MTRQPPESTACGACGAPLRADQRYCLQCGARHGAPRVDPLATLGFAAEPSAAPAAVAAPAPEEAAAGPARRGPSRRVAVALAAVTLALGVAAGAALGPSPAPSIAAAPQRLVALVVPAAAPATTTTDEESTPPEDEGSSETPSADDDSASEDDTTSADDDTTSDDTTTDASDDADTDTTSADDTDTTSADDDTTTTAPLSTTPAHVFVVSLTQLDASAFAPTSPLGDLVAQGTLLSGYAAAGPSAAANELALLGGQVPTADCAAALAACVLPAGDTSLPDQLRTANLTWRAYVEDATQRCATTPSARVGVSLFTTLGGRKDCATNAVDPAALDADLATVDKTPALSLLIPNACHDGSATPCAEGAPAGLDAAAGPLKALVAKITASAAYKADGVLIILSDAPPPAAADPATPPLPLGALVLSPRATAARAIATPTGPLALLRSLEDLFGLDPLGAAAQVTAPALDGVLAPVTATASAASVFPHPSHPSNTTRRSP